MKNKKNIYFLVPSVLLIWGIIGYKIISALNPNDPLEFNNTVVEFKPDEIKDTEKFSINVDYRDPFLGKIVNQNSKVNFSKSSINSTKDSVQFPEVIYKGMVSPKNSNRTSSFFVSINNEEQILSIGNEFKGVKLLNGTTKNIIISFKNKKKIIPIQQ